MLEGRVLRLRIESLNPTAVFYVGRDAAIIGTAHQEPGPVLPLYSRARLLASVATQHPDYTAAEAEDYLDNVVYAEHHTHPNRPYILSDC